MHIGVMWHMSIGPTTKQKPNIIHMKGNALMLFGLFHHFDVIFMVANSPWLLITNYLNF
jgi:hypothetical protein